MCTLVRYNCGVEKESLNGEKDKEDELILKLSDSFPRGAEADIEVTVRMININHGRNSKLLDACEPLKEYSWLIEEIRKNLKIMEIKDAVDKALADMPKEYVIIRQIIWSRFVQFRHNH